MRVKVKLSAKGSGHTFFKVQLSPHHFTTHLQCCTSIFRLVPLLNGLLPFGLKSVVVYADVINSPRERLSECTCPGEFRTQFRFPICAGDKAVFCCFKHLSKLVNDIPLLDNFPFQF